MSTSFVKRPKTVNRCPDVNDSAFTAVERDTVLVNESIQKSQKRVIRIRDWTSGRIPPC